jgi:hypothetical protein
MLYIIDKNNYKTIDNVVELIETDDIRINLNNKYIKKIFYNDNRLYEDIFEIITNYLSNNQYDDYYQEVEEENYKYSLLDKLIIFINQIKNLFYN